MVSWLLYPDFLTCPSLVPRKYAPSPFHGQRTEQMTSASLSHGILGTMSASLFLIEPTSVLTLGVLNVFEIELLELSGLFS